MEKVVNAIVDEITAAMARGDRVELRGFGTFAVKTRPARTACNPRTGALVEVRQKRFPFFRTGKEMRERVNSPPKVEVELAPSVISSVLAERVAELGIKCAPCGRRRGKS